MPDEPDNLSALSERVATLSAQVAHLEQRLSALEQGRGTFEPAIPPVVANPPEPQQRPRDHLESRLGLTIVNRIGAITLAIGIIFFFKYAVDNRWIGASGRVFLGLLAGLVLIGVADWLRKRGQSAFSQGICGCGLATLYISLYASFAYYQLVPQSAAFAGMIATCVLAAFLSFAYDNPAIASLGLIGAFIAPMLLRNPQRHLWLVFLYLLLLDLASLALAAWRRWIVLLVIAFAGTVILFLSWATQAERASLAAGVFFLCVFFALFFAMSVRASLARASQIGASLLPINAFWALLSAWMLLHRDHSGWIACFALGLAVTHIASAYSGSRPGPLFHTLYAVGHACLLTTGVRLLVQWSAQQPDPAARASFLSESVSVLFAVYAVAVIALGVFRRSAIDRVIGLVLIGIVVIKLYFYDVWRLTRFYRISAFVALGVLLLAASYIYSRFRDKLEVLWSGEKK